MYYLVDCAKIFVGDFMRIRNVKNKEEFMNNSSYLLKNYLDYKGRWNSLFNNNLTIDRVVQHHYFSGKNCPETKRNAGLWKFFKTIISAEYQMLQYQKMGYSFEFISESDYLNEKGRVIKTIKEETIVKYTIIVKDKEGNSLDKSFTSNIYPD